VSDHNIDVYYTVYELGYYCTWDCYSWGDVYGYSHVGCVPIPDEPATHVCDPPVYTTTGTGTIPSGRVWVPPDIVTVILLAQVFLGQTVKSATAEDLGPPTLVVTSNGQQISSGQTVYISSTPETPTIGAYLVGPSAANGMVSFQLSIQYDGTTKNYPAGFPDDLFGYQTWTAPWSEFWGGEATVHWIFNGITQPDFNFKIRGQNPSQQAMIDMLNASGYWFAWRIAKAESGLKQFNDNGTPVFGSPNGWGVMQLDPSDNDQQKWNWQMNIQAGLARLQQNYIADGYEFWRRQVTQWHQWNVANPANTRIPPDDIPEATCTFTLSPAQQDPWTQPTAGGGTYWFGDAIAIKRYNGASSPPGSGEPGNYITWRNTGDYVDDPYWHFTFLNSNSLNYVNRVCSQ
jgi:hypothetical protein